MVLQIETIERKGFGYVPFDYGDHTNEQEEYTEQLRKNKPLIKEILETYPKATNNDVILYFEFLRMKFEGIEVTSSKDRIIFKFPRKDIPFFPSPESATRCRRGLNAKGIGLPTNKHVFLKRMRRQKAIQQYYKGKI